MYIARQTSELVKKTLGNFLGSAIEYLIGNALHIPSYANIATPIYLNKPEILNGTAFACSDYSNENIDIIIKMTTAVKKPIVLVL